MRQTRTNKVVVPIAVIAMIATLLFGAPGALANDEAEPAAETVAAAADGGTGDQPSADVVSNESEPAADTEPEEFLVADRGPVSVDNENVDNENVEDANVDNQIVEDVTVDDIIATERGFRPRLSALSGAALAPALCNGDIYVSLGNPTSLNTVDTSTTPFGLTQINTPADRYDAIGFNVLDGYLYGWDWTNNEVIRIAADGTTTGLGVPPEMAGVQNLNFNLGDLDASNNYYVGEALGTSNSQIWQIDLGTFTATNLTSNLTAGTWANNFTFDDISFNPADSKLYLRGRAGNDLITIDPVTLVLDRPGNVITGPLSAGNRTIGQWFDGNGDLYFYRNDGNIYRVDVAALSSELVSTGAAAASGDAARCSYQPVFNKSVWPPVALTGDTVTYTFEIVNPLPAGSSPLVVDLDDTMPGGLTVVPGSVAVTGATGSTNSSTAASVAVTGLSIAPSTTAIITVDVTVGATTVAGVYNNQATITGLPAGLGGTVLSDDPTLPGLLDETPLTIAQPNICSADVFLSTGNPTQLAQLDVSSSPFTGSNIGSATDRYDGIGFNVIDGLLYGWDLTNNEIVTIDAAGNVVGIGVPPEMLAVNAQDLAFNSGDMDANNNFFLGKGNAIGGDSQVWRIDLTTFTAVLITDPSFIQPEPNSINWATNNGFADLAFNPADSKIYFRGQAGNDLFTLNPFTGDYYRALASTVHSWLITGDMSPGPMIGQWFDSAGDLYFYQPTGTTYRVALPSRVSEVVSTGGPAVAEGDAARCTYLPSFTKEASVAVASRGDTVTYTFEITNNLPPASVGDPLTIDVDDVVPAGLEIDAASIAVAGSTVYTDATVDESSTLDINGLQIAANSSVTITFDTVVPADATAGDYTNQATISGLPTGLGTTMLSDDPTLPGFFDPTPLRIDVVVPIVCASQVFLATTPAGQDTVLSTVDTTVTPFAETQLGTPSTVFDAMGYNIVDGLLYAYDYNLDELITIDANGVIRPVGLPTGMVAGEYTAADVDVNGVMQIVEAGPQSAIWTSNRQYRIDLTSLPLTATALTGLGGGTGVPDVAFHPVDGRLLYRERNEIRQISTTTGARTVIGTETGVSNAPLNALGQWFDSSNTLFARLPNGFYSYQIDAPYTSALISAAPATSFIGDAASCAFQPNIKKSVSPGIAAPGDTVTYSFELINSLPASSAALSVSLDDVLPASLEIDKASLSVTGTTVYTDNTVDGSDTLALDAIELAGASSVVVTIDAVIPAATATPATVTNQATLGDLPVGLGTSRLSDDPALPGLFDPTPLQIVSVDLEVTKTDGETAAESGDTLTYTIVASNNGPDDIDGVRVVDTFPAELTPCSTTSVAASGATGNTAGPFTTDIDETLDMPSGSTVTYTTACTVTVTVNSTVSNTATISHPVLSSETDTTNNTATDDTVITIPGAFECDSTFYLQQGDATSTPLYSVDTSVDPFGLTQIGGDPGPFATLGYNQVDNFLYAFDRERTLYRILSDGSRTNLGVVAGLPASTIFYAGDIDANGIFLLRNHPASGPDRFFEVDLTDPTFPVTTLAASGPNGADLSFNPLDGQAYTFDSTGGVSRIDRTTGVVTQIIAPGGFGGVGGSYFDAEGNFYGSVNSGAFIRADLGSATPTIAQISTSVTSGANDGASCPVALDAKPGVAKTMSVAAADDGPWAVTIDYALENFGNEGVGDISITDDLQAVFGTEGTDWSLTSITKTSGPATFTVNTGFDGETAGDIELVTADSRIGAAGSGSETAGLRVVIDVNTPGTYVNSVTLNGEGLLTGETVTDDSINDANVDPDGDDDPTNNTNPATITIAIPDYDLEITKTDGVAEALPGDTLTYTIVATNNGPDDIDDVAVADAFPTGLTCSTTSVAAGGATGNTAGAFTTDIADTLDMPSGSSVTYTAACVVGAAVSGTVSNTATVATPVTTPESDTTNNSATDTTEILMASIDLVKTVIPATGSCPGIDGTRLDVATGTDVIYCFAVTNAGASALIDVEVSDPALSLTGVDALTVANLAAGDVETVQSAPFAAADLTNTATASGDPATTGFVSFGGTAVTATDTAEVASITRSFTFNKTVMAAGGTCAVDGVEFLKAAEGAPITYCFVIVNNGEADLNLATMSFSDPTLGISQTDLSPAPAGTLASGGSITYTYDTVGENADVLNTAEVTLSPAGSLIGATPYTLTDTATVSLFNPYPHVVKSAGATTVAASGVDGNVDVVFTIVGANLGTEPLTDIRFEDNLSAQMGINFVNIVSAPVVTGDLAATRANTGFNGSTDPNLLLVDVAEVLAVGESFTITFTAELDPDADTAIDLENVATITVTPPTGPPLVEPTTPITVEVSQYDLVKTQVDGGPSTTTPNMVDLSFEITMTNTGTEPLTDLVVTDDLATQYGTALVSVGDPVVTGDIDPGRANYLFDGVGDINLLMSDPAEALEAGESFVIAFTVTVNPIAAGAPQPLENAAEAECEAPPAGPECGNTETPPVPAVVKSLAVTKQASDPMPAASGVFGNVDVQFTVQMTSNGTEAVDDLTLTDDLAGQFGGAFVAMVVAPAVTGDLVPGRANGNFDGVGDINLLTADPTEALAPGESVTVTFTIEIDPDAEPTLVPLTNVATGTGGGPTGPVVSPPEEIPVGSIAAAKLIAAQANAASGIAGNIDLTYGIVVVNVGADAVISASVVDDMQSQLGSAFVGVVTAPVITSTDATVAPVPNAAYDGTGDLLDTTAVTDIKAGESFRVEVTVEIDPDADGAPAELGNVATASGTTSSGPIPEVETIIGFPFGGEPGPVVLDVPDIAVTQTVDIDNNGAGTYTVAFGIEAFNTGATSLADVGLEHDLAAVFADAVSWTPISVASDDFVTNPAFDGVFNQALLAPNSNTLAIAESGTLQVLVEVVPDPADAIVLAPGADLSEGFGSDGADDDSAENFFRSSMSGDDYFDIAQYESQVEGSGVSPDGVWVFDLSGDDVTVDNPLRFHFFEHLVIGAAKEVTSTATTAAGELLFEYQIHAHNYGNVEVNELQIVDDLNATFPGLPFTVTSVTSPTLTVNAVYDGSTDTQLLAGVDTLGIGESASIALAVTVGPADSLPLGPYENVAVVSGTSPGGQPGSRPTDPGNVALPPTGDGGDPTEVTVPTPGYDLAVTVTADAGNNDTEWTIVVENVGTEPTPGVATLTFAVPGGLSITDESWPTGWTCTDEGAGNYMCVSAAPVAVDASVSFTFTADASSDVYTVVGTTTGGPFEVNTANNVDDDTVAATVGRRQPPIESDPEPVDDIDDDIPELLAFTDDIPRLLAYSGGEAGFLLRVAGMLMLMGIGFVCLGARRRERHDEQES